MLEHQDLVQSSSKAYGEKLLCDTFVEAIGRVNPDDSDLKDVLMRLFHLYMVSAVEADMAHFVGSGLMTPTEAGQLVEVSQRLCAEMAPDALAICEAFGLSERLLEAPIASDWVEYNRVDNQGEHL